MPAPERPPRPMRPGFFSCELSSSSVWCFKGGISRPGRSPTGKYGDDQRDGRIELRRRAGNRQGRLDVAAGGRRICIDGVVEVVGDEERGAVHRDRREERG